LKLDILKILASDYYGIKRLEKAKYHGQAFSPPPSATHVINTVKCEKIKKNMRWLDVLLTYCCIQIQLFWDIRKKFPQYFEHF